jgi:methylamine--corrinoid protein Co-methyltransferase
MVDFWARAEEGDLYDEKFFDLKIFWKNLKEISEKYEIQYDPDNVIPSDDGDLLDRIFLAAKELVLKSGVFCLSTGRIINFESWEIDEALRLIPDKVFIGEGNERLEVKYRGLKSEVPPPILGRVLGPQSADVIEKVFESFAKEPIIDHFHFQGVIEKVFGVPVRPNSPFEMMQEVIRTGYAKNVLKRVGRTGAYDGASTPVSVRAMMVGFDPRWGKTSSDGAHSYLMPPMKVDYEQLTRVYFYHLHGIKFWTSSNAFIGGLDGPPAAAAVSLVAGGIAEQMLFQPALQQFAPTLVDYSCPSARASIWAGEHAAASFIKHTRCAYVRAQPGGIITAGLGKEHFWEVAATALACTVINCVVSAGTGKQSGARDCAAGISARFAGEVAHAAVGMDKAQANDLVLRFLSKYEDRIKDKTLHTLGKTFQECYDLERVVPNKEILKELDEVKKEIKEMGFDIQ